MIKYDVFFRNFILRRPGDFSKIHQLEALTELPLGCVLHTTSGLVTGYNKRAEVVPDDQLYSQFYGSRKLNMFFVRDQPHDDDLIIPDTNGAKLLLAGVDQDIKKYRSSDLTKIFLIRDTAYFNNSNIYLNVMCHEPLFRSIVTGVLQTIRVFDICLASVLNQVVKLQQFDHFMVFNTENLPLSRSDFTRSFMGYNRQTIKYHNSIYYLAVMHLIGFLYSRSTDSMFNKLPPGAIAKINLMFRNGDRFVIYNLAVLKEMVEKTPNLLIQLINQLNGLSSSTGALAATSEETVPEQLVEVPPAATTNITVFKKTQTVVEDSKQSAALSKKHDDSVAKQIILDTDSSQEKKKYVADVAHTYKEIAVSVPVQIAENTKDDKVAEAVSTAKKIVSGKAGPTEVKTAANTGTAVSMTVQQLLNTPLDKTVSKSDVTHAVDIPDKSMLESTVANFATDYMQKAFKKDLVAILVGFGKQGMFLVDLQEVDVSDSLSSLIKYTAIFKDKDGKQHTIRFTLPKVDEAGNCMINGTLKSLVIQRINTPICKVAPNRVALSSNYNKTIVQRNETFSNNFLAYVRKLFSLAGDSIVTTLSTGPAPNLALPYEYTVLAANYATIKAEGLDWKFDFANRLKGDDGTIDKLEYKYGVYMGTYKTAKCFLSVKGVLTLYTSDEELSRVTILNVLKEVLHDVVFPAYNEWVNLTVLNKSIPVMFILCYRFGMSNMFKYLGLRYDIVMKSARADIMPSDVVLKFSDAKIIVRSPSVVQRLLVAGMNHYNLSDLSYTEMNSKDAYYELMISKKLSINYLRGVDDLFELFVDPITEDVLLQMGEPTNFRDLLIRATVLLSTEDAKGASSSANFRYRSYERFNAVVYKHMARALTSYRNKAPGHKNKFSISEYDIITAVMNDPLMMGVDIVNPIGDLRSRHKYSHIGDGGRSEEAMVINDRRYPRDGIGIISEATSDSGNVGIDGVLSTNPSIANIRGMCYTKNIAAIQSTEILSPTALLLPGADLDD
jgi:hypothetical protein